MRSGCEFPLRSPYRWKTSSYTATGNIGHYDTQVICKQGDGVTITLTLPSAVGAEGAFFEVINAYAATSIIAAQMGETIDGDPSYTMDTEGESVVLCSDGEKWVRSSLPSFATAIQQSVLGSVLWGALGGSMADQADLKYALDTRIENSFETVSQNLRDTDKAFLYHTSGPNLGSLNYIEHGAGANLVVKTFNYTTGKLTSIVLSGAGLPVGILTTKTFGYALDGTLETVEYS